MRDVGVVIEIDEFMLPNRQENSDCPDRQQPNDCPILPYSHSHDYGFGKCWKSIRKRPKGSGAEILDEWFP
jgi:hypothetical protein